VIGRVLNWSQNEDFISPHISVKNSETVTKKEELITIETSVGEK
jgi:hypothetical protein